MMNGMKILHLMKTYFPTACTNYLLQKSEGILRRPTNKFPEHEDDVREGVGPLKDPALVSPEAKWTKIDRRLVNPKSLMEKNKRFEERQDCVIVLRVLTKRRGTGLCGQNGGNQRWAIGCYWFSPFVVFANKCTADRGKESIVRETGTRDYFFHSGDYFSDSDDSDFESDVLLRRERRERRAKREADFTLKTDAPALVAPAEIEGLETLKRDAELTMELARETRAKSDLACRVEIQTQQWSKRQF
jgi:hypothetical protein